MSFVDALIDGLCDRQEFLNDERSLTSIADLLLNYEMYKGKRVVHLISDSPYCNEFIKLAKDSFYCKHHFFVPLGTLKYLNLEAHDESITRIVSASILNGNVHYIQHVLNILDEFDVICVQFAFEYYKRLVFQARKFLKNKVITWSPWGGDLYPYLYPCLVDQRSREIISKYFQSGCPSFESHLFKSKDLQSFIDNLDIIFLHDDASQLLSNYYDCKNILLIDNVFHNPTMTENVERKKSFKSGQQFKNDQSELSIIIGNSMTWENNHLSALEQIAQVVKQRKNKVKISIFASYGFSVDSWYYKIVYDFATKLFPKEDIRMITDFLPKEEYQNFLSQHDIMIFNHIRMQAASSILTSIDLGLKVFLRPENMRHSFYSRVASHIDKKPFHIYNNIQNLINSEQKDFFADNEMSIKDYNETLPYLSTFGFVFR